MRFKLAFVIWVLFVIPAFGQSSGLPDALVDVNRAPEVITVGGPNADIPAFTGRAIQLAIDALKTRGGGTVRLGKGTFMLQGPVRLASNMTLEGAGPETVLRKSEGFKTSFTVDADYGMQKVRVKDPSGFKVGTGIQLYDKLHSRGWGVTTAMVTAIAGDVLYLDNRTVHDYLSTEDGVISNAFSPVEAVEVENVRIANLTVDGNKASNDYINGCRGGGIYVHKSRNCAVEGVHVTNFNGDSFSWQITEDISVRRCEASNGGGLGFHPGTGSVRSIVEENTSHHNKEDGFFLCWRVQHGVFRKNVSYANGRYGISIGHQDTDNLFEQNHVYENTEHGVCFRQETEANGGHRNTFRDNIIENNGTGGKTAYGFFVGGHTNDIVIEKNTIRSTGKGTQQAAVCMGPNAQRVTVKDNNVAGHAEMVKK